VRAGVLSTTSTDAVNGAQLNATNQNVSNLTSTVTSQGNQISNLTTSIANGTVGMVQQAGGEPNGDITVGAQTGGTRVNMAGTSGTRTVAGVSAGALTATSTDAVNGSQLYATNQRVGTLETQIANLQDDHSDVQSLKGQMNDAFKSIDRLRGGVAIALATSGFALEAGKKFGVGMNMGFYDGKAAYTVQTAARLDQTWTVNGALGYSPANGKPGGRVGVSAQW
jgi:autotransporter adhesin